MQLAINTIRGKPLARSARCQAENALLVLEKTAVISLAVAIGEAKSKHTVEPALEDSGNIAPPDRIQPDHKIGTHEALLLAHDIGGKSAHLVRVALLVLIMKPRRVGGSQKVMPAGNRIEAFAVKVGHLNRMSSLAQCLKRRVLQSRRERRRLGMNIN